MKNNKGFSLVELIVVIAIMGVLTGIITISTRTILGSRVKECAANIESQLKMARETTMGKSRVTLKIYRNESGEYYSELTTYDADQTTVLSTDKKRVGRKSITLKYSTDSVSYTTMNNSDSFIVEYDRSSGAMKNQSSCVREIVISSGSKEKKIKMYPETGKVEVK